MLGIAHKIWMLGMLVIVLVSAWGQGRFMAGLRYDHSAVWHRLGRPTMSMLSSEPRAIFRLLSYVALAQYRDLADTKMQLYGATLRYSVVALFVWFVAGITFLILW